MVAQGSGGVLMPGGTEEVHGHGLLMRSGKSGHWLDLMVGIFQPK